MPALTAEQDALLATAPAEDLLDLDFVKDVRDTLHAYQMSKRCNSLRVRGEAINWAKRGARINSISPGIIVTPLASDELHGERADFYQAMLKKMPAGRAGTPDRGGRACGAYHGAGRRLRLRQRLPDRRGCNGQFFLRP